MLHTQLFIEKGLRPGREFTGTLYLGWKRVAEPPQLGLPPSLVFGTLATPPNLWIKGRYPLLGYAWALS
jgi:hypothetical protein